MSLQKRRLVVAGTAALLVAALVVTLAITWSSFSDRTDSASSADPCDPRPRASTASGPSSTASTAASPSVDAARGVPVRLQIPSLAVDAIVVPISAKADGTLDPPEAVQQVGWWQDGAQAGSARGSVVCTGHTVRAGGGVFNDLGEVEPGALVRVTTARGTIDYTVTEVTEVSKEDFADVAGDLFSQRVPSRLVLVTCSRYRLGRYRANTVVVSMPASR